MIASWYTLKQFIELAQKHYPTVELVDMEIPSSSGGVRRVRVIVRSTHTAIWHAHPMELSDDALLDADTIRRHLKEAEEEYGDAIGKPDKP